MKIYKSYNGKILRATSTGRILAVVTGDIPYVISETGQILITEYGTRIIKETNIP
jgi:hypothetical protein